MKTQQTGKKLYSLPEVFVILWRAMGALPTLRKDDTLSPQMRERIMLAVTQVNGCAMCSYAHAQMALEAGMAPEDISAMLAGEEGDTPAEELPAVLFAQHYADTRGRPTMAAWRDIQARYGRKKARAILSAIQVIMAGNAYGIPMGSLRGRLAGKAEQIDPRSSLGYEIAMALVLPLLLPAGLSAAVTTAALGAPRF